MYQLRRILVCTDLSAPARHAAERAALVAAAVGAEVDVVHVMTTGWRERMQALLQDHAGDVGRQLHDANTQGLEELVSRLREKSGAGITGKLLEGPVVPTLLSAAEQGAADLIVLGARGSGFMRHALLGSTAERMIRKARCPMLVVKQGPHEAYRRALLALDLSPVAQRVIEAGRAVAPGARLLPLHAYELLYEGKMRYAGVDESTIRRYRESACAESAARFDAILRSADIEHGLLAALLTHGDPVACILEQEQERDCDLIVVGKQGEGKFEELLLGSVTKHVLNESRADVLIAG